MTTTVRKTVWMPKTLIEEIDQFRGGMSFSAWVTEALRQEFERLQVTGDVENVTVLTEGEDVRVVQV